MALTITITPGELERQAILVYQGQPFEAFLVNNSLQATPLTAANTYANWKAAELSGNGYIAVTGSIGFGTYNTTTNRFELPPFVAGFSAVGGAIDFDTLCVRVGGGTALHSIQVEDPAVSILDGGSRTYLISLVQDD